MYQKEINWILLFANQKMLLVSTETPYNLLVLLIIVSLVITILSESQCVKSVYVRSYSGPYFPAFLSIFSPNARKCGPEQLRIWTLFTQHQLLTSLRLRLSHLRKYKFRKTFQDTVNPLCSSGEAIEISSHYFRQCLIWHW